MASLDTANRTRYRGERFVVEGNGEPVARLGPAGTPRGIILDEFFDPLRTPQWPDEGFPDDLKEIQANQPKTK